MYRSTDPGLIGGHEQSVHTFTTDFRDMGHDVLVVTLEVPGARSSDEQVVRLPAVTEAGGTEFSMRLPVPSGLHRRLDSFSPDVVHSHHPFMLGDTAFRVARRHGLPLVFTHHTLYEEYTYLFSRESSALEQMAMHIATEYANLCDHVVAPTRRI